MTPNEIVATLKERRSQLGPVALAELLNELSEDGLHQRNLIFYFKQAFADVPLHALIQAGAWSRISDGGLSDVEFAELLEPWLGET